MTKAIGIDLGTTNTCVAYLNKTIPRIIHNINNKATTPSIVTLPKRRVGTPDTPQNTIFAVKRLIGRKLADVKEYVRNLPYKTFAHRNGDVWVKYNNTKISPVEVSAEILKYVKGLAELKLKREVNEAVVTVPAYFDDSQRQATKDAGHIAGLRILRVINEPTAAALAYGLDKVPNATIAVYDLGGGTFDISILDIKDGVFEVLSTNGDANLGGEDIDNEIRLNIAKRFEKENDVMLDTHAMYKIKEAVENMKKELSFVEKARITIPEIVARNGSKIDLEYLYSREDIEIMVKDIVKKTIKPCMNALKDAKLSKDKIKHVILVGGSTRMPLVRKTVFEIFGKAPESSVNPDEVVAKGAAIQAGILEGNVSDVILLDVNSLSLGIETIGGLFSKIIKRNTTLPTKQTQVFTTAEDNQTDVEIKIYQGERPLVKHNKLLGEIKLKDIPPMKKGTPLIEVTFEGDSNGIYNVTARDAILNKQQRMEIKPASGLNEEEIEKIIEEAKEEKEADQKRLECTKLRIEVDRLKLRGIESEELNNYISDDIFDIKKAKEFITDLIA